MEPGYGAHAGRAGAAWRNPVHTKNQVSLPYSLPALVLPTSASFLTIY
jgi:hypothetical protein